MLNLIQNQSIIQIAIVTDDLEGAAKRFAKFFGFPEIPETSPFAPPEIAKVVFNGERAENAYGCSVNFNFGNLQVEFIQPNEAPSSWRNWLNTHGESIHHLAFTVSSLKDCMNEAEKRGARIEQSGTCADGVSRYAYIDTNGAVPVRLEAMEIPWLNQAK